MDHKLCAAANTKHARRFALRVAIGDRYAKTKTPYTYLSIYLPNKTPKSKTKTEDSKEVNPSGW